MSIQTRYNNTNDKAHEITDNMGVIQRIIKRIFDIIGAILGLILFSPLFLVIFIRLKQKNEGSVIFKQERIGYGGKPFYIYKFRTFQADAESEGPCLAPNNDEKLTSYGKFLRERHLDELPQFWNVLTGDMSIVGPRPERKFYIDKIMQHNPNYSYIYLMRPGLPSEATLKNGYTDTMEKMLRRLDMDLNYLQTRSLLIDIKIVLLTARMILSGKKF